MQFDVMHLNLPRNLIQQDFAVSVQCGANTEEIVNTIIFYIY